MHGADIGGNLKRLLSERDMSQSELARRIAKTPAQVNNYINGKSIPPLKVIEQIASVLCVDELSIIDKPVITGGIDHFLLQRVTRAMRRLSPDGQREAVERVEELTELPRYRKE